MQLQKWLDIMIQKQKQKTFSSFLYEICSWYPLRMYPGENGMTIYPGNNRHAKTISQEEFEATRDTLEHIEKTTETGFFEDFGDLFQRVSLPGFHHYYSVENSAYSNHVSSSKNAYSSFHVTGDCENVLYSLSTKIHASNIYNSVMSWMQSENVYQSLGVVRSTNIYYSKYIQDSHNVWFSTDLIGCHDCIFCSDQTNLSYAIHNVVYTQAEYEVRKADLLRDKSSYPLYYQNLRGIGKSRGSVNTTGKYCNNSENVENGYYSVHVHRGKNLLFTGHPDGLSDAYNSLFVSAGRGYYGACGVGGDSEEIYNSVSIMRSSHCYYSYFLESCSFCLGCVGLKNKSYYILNTPYEKEAWYAKVSAIFTAMDAEGVLGEFFPATLCPFYFEDSLAKMMLRDVSQAHIESLGFLFGDPSQKENTIRTDAISSESLDRYEHTKNSTSWDIDSAVCNEIIRDSTGKYYRIEKMEREFLIQHSLPLPRNNWMTRIENNFR